MTGGGEEGLRRDMATLRRVLDRPPGRKGRLGKGACLTGRPFLVLLSGLPGTGKSHFARELARRASFLVLESDRLRKALAPSPKYTKGENARLFAACHRLITGYLAEGRRVLFDATNLMEAHRQPLYDLVDQMGVPLIVVRLTAPEETIRRRLAARAAKLSAGEHSDADWRVYRRMVASEEPIGRKHITVDSSGDIEAALEEIIRRVNAAG